LVVLGFNLLGDGLRDALDPACASETPLDVRIVRVAPHCSRRSGSASRRLGPHPLTGLET